MSSVKHAIIVAAGFGSRRLPVTKAVEKEMMPLLNRPVVDYIVQDCIDAGVEHIVFVVGEGSEQIKNYYSTHAVLEKYLADRGKDKQLGQIAPPAVSFDFVEQTNHQLFNMYGTNTAVAIARNLIPAGERALVLMGDAFLYSTGRNTIREMVETTTEDEAAVLAIEIPREEVTRYGVLDVDENGYLRCMVEKPSVEEAPSNLINSAEYIFTSDMLDEVVKFHNEEYPEGKERYVNIEPLERFLASGGKMKVATPAGVFLDAGTTEGWLRANIYLAKEQGIEY
ncbi:NTP transferase domain-containing protein [Candidatus Saccharibacteria bacterium]|nr:NTP transferase domain-containing protein [Candidatus Saccharibacteria bacterium]